MANKKRIQRIRSIQKAEKQHEHLAARSQEFPKNEPGVIYVRQSTITQVQKNLHSYEMQTDEFVAYFRDVLGVTGYIEIVADDEGKSGTLDIHDREGLLRVTRLIEGKELLNGKRIGWVGAVHVNRLTRDQWLIVPGVLMRECYEHDVWIVTLRMQFHFKDEYCQRVFMLEAEESARHLKWMKEILGGGRQAASDRGYYDGRNLIPGYIVEYREYFDDDTPNPHYKKYICYEPHAAVIRWLFQMYLELDGNFAALCRKVEMMPYLFPAFERWVDKRCVNKFIGGKRVIQDDPYKGCYRISAHGLRSILTNPTYIGWWIPMGGGLVEDNHEPLVEETLFTYAHKRLSLHDHHGNRQKPALVNRNSTAEALLKKIIQGQDRTISVYPRMDAGYKGALVYTAQARVGLHQEHRFTVLAALLDDLFARKLLARLQEWEANGDLAKWKEKMEENKAEKNEHNKHIRKSIQEAQAKMKRINELLIDIENPPSKSQENDLKQMYRDLEIKKAQLEHDLKGTPEDEAEEEIILFRIWELIPSIKKHWGQLPFEERMKVVGAFARRVVVSVPAPGWLKMEMEWKIGQYDIMHVRRHTNVRVWSREEDALLREWYPTRDGMEVLNCLPTRSWGAIVTRAYTLGVKRTNKANSARLKDFANVSLHDLVYAQEQGLVISDKNAQWS